MAAEILVVLIRLVGVALVMVIMVVISVVVLVIKVVIPVLVVRDYMGIVREISIVIIIVMAMLVVVVPVVFCMVVAIVRKTSLIGDIKNNVHNVLLLLGTNIIVREVTILICFLRRNSREIIFILML